MAFVLVIFCMLTLELFPVLGNIIFSGILNRGQRLLFALGAMFLQVWDWKIRRAVWDLEAKVERGLFYLGA